MLTKERRSAIAVLVGERGAVDVKELTTRFGVTNETVRKDLIALEQGGLLERTHGGALRAERQHLQPLSCRIKQNHKAKSSVAAAAARLVCDGDVVAIDSGSTALLLAECLRKQPCRLTVVTNAVDVMRSFEDVPDIQVIFTGGYYDKEEMACYGEPAVSALENLHITKAFVTPSAINEKGLFIIHSAYLSLMRAYLKQADAAYIMVTKDKFLVNAPLLLCRLDASLTLVTDSEIDDRTLQRFAGYSIEVGPA